MTPPFLARDQWSSSKPLLTVRQQAAPWVILGVWLAVDLAVVIYWSSREWGFLQALPLVIELAFHLLGLATWLSAFAALADCSVRLRAGYFTVGTLAVAALFVWILGFGDSRTVFAFATFLLGLALPFWIVYRLGWRIRTSPAAAGGQTRGKWQFTVADLLVTTTLIGLFLGLLLASGGLHSLDDVYIMAALICGAPAVIVVSLAWQRFWRAAAVNVLGCTLLAVLPLAWHDSASPIEMVLLMLVVSGPLVSLLAASACLRSAGYRLC